MSIDQGAHAIVPYVRVALESGDLAAFAELLHPDVTWGTPNNQGKSCRNRSDVLAWYRRGREQGMRADVTDVVAREDKVLVSLQVFTADTGRDQAVDRWQVLTVRDGLVTEIEGFETRPEQFSADSGHR